MNVVEAVKNEARRLGFDLVGITTPEPPPHFSFYEQWLNAGYHAGMAYLDTSRARTRRADPRNILPECRSILVLGICYPPAAPPQNVSRPTGRIASYAWGPDYHEVLQPKLAQMVRFMEEQLGRSFPNRWYTDTGPILERDIAQRAGLGWTGKNTCLIHPRSGSYFLLSEILLGIELPPDPPFTADHCGTCTRCIDACPTDCILPDRTLDAGRCISYLTIENKGEIPEALRRSIGDWVFGCDICQEVCPWNIRFALPAESSPFNSRPDLAYPDLAEELQLTAETFNRKFKDHPVKRSKRRGYLRSVAVALGNAGNPETVPVLAESLLHEIEPLVRAHAAWALGQIGTGEACDALAQALATESSPEVLREIRSALNEPGGH